jgi:hypothetical protein
MKFRLVFKQTWLESVFYHHVCLKTNLNVIERPYFNVGRNIYLFDFYARKMNQNEALESVTSYTIADS